MTYLTIGWLLKIRKYVNEKENILVVKMIKEQQTLQNEKGDGQCARSDRTEFEDESMEIDTLCASEMKINSENLTAFTCLAVYDMATPTTLPPVSSPSLVDGGGGTHDYPPKAAYVQQ